MIRSDSAPERPLASGKLPPELLRRLIASYVPTAADVLVGPGVGRDAAAIAFGDRVLVAKTDPITFAADGAAAYLVDVNANDLACLGARPRWLLATALFREGATEREVEEQFSRLGEACAAREIALVGGHSEVMDGLDRTVLVGLMLGEAEAGRLLRPGGARPGDRLLLTKAIALEGTALLARELARTLEPLVGAEVVQRARELLGRPGISVMRDAEVVLTAGGVTALHDPTEGGLAGAARELALASGCGVRLERGAIPLLLETKRIARALGLDPIGMLASGSLLVAANPDAVLGILAAGRAAHLPITEIGAIEPAEAGCSLIERDGRAVALPRFDTDEVGRALAEARARA